MHFYAESVNNPEAFKSVNAGSWNDYKTKDYYFKSAVSMGFGVSPTYVAF